MANRWPRANAVTNFVFFTSLLGFTLYRLAELGGHLPVLVLYGVGVVAGLFGFADGLPPLRRRLGFLRRGLSKRHKRYAIVGALIAAAIVGQLFATGSGPDWLAALVAGCVAGLCCIGAAAAIHRLIAEPTQAP